MTWKGALKQHFQKVWEPWRSKALKFHCTFRKNRSPHINFLFFFLVPGGRMLLLLLPAALPALDPTKPEPRIVDIAERLLPTSLPANAGETHQRWCGEPAARNMKYGQGCLIRGTSFSKVTFSIANTASGIALCKISLPFLNIWGQTKP